MPSVLVAGVLVAGVGPYPWLCSNLQSGPCIHCGGLFLCGPPSPACWGLCALASRTPCPALPALTPLALPLCAVDLVVFVAVMIPPLSPHTSCCVGIGSLTVGACSLHGERGDHSLQHRVLALRLCLGESLLSVNLPGERVTWCFTF